MFKQIKTLLLLSTSIATLSACNGGTANNNNSGGSITPNQANNLPLTIDNAGVIPVFNNLPTNTKLYVHNNSTKSIQNISYTQSLAGSATSTGIDNGQCSIIPAGSACAIDITTPTLRDKQHQGALIITATYDKNGKQSSFSQVVSYSKVIDSDKNSGVKFMSGVQASGYGNNTGYATIYLYAGGVKKSYKITQVNISKSAQKITNGLTNNQMINSNQVQAVEISSPVATSAISSRIEVAYNELNNSVQSKTLQAQKNQKISNMSSSQSSSTNLTILPSGNGAILTSGYIPFIDTATESTGTIIIQNAGNANSGAIKINNSYNSITLDSASSCLTTANDLPAGQTCYLQFQIRESAPASATISLDYPNGLNNVIGNTNLVINSYNSLGGALVEMEASNPNISFPATTSESSTITIKNVGGYPLYNINLGDNIDNNSTTVTFSNNTCSSTLEVNDSCTVVVTVTSQSTIINGSLIINLTANYDSSNGNNSYSRLLPMTYNSTPYGAIITLTPVSNPIIMNIAGNNTESQTSLIQINNLGNLPASLSTPSLSGESENLSIVNTNCSNNLSANESCTNTLKLGPVEATTAESGLGYYELSYTANSGQNTSGTLSTPINWSIQPQTTSISLIGYTASGAHSGNGSTESGYKFYGNYSGQQTITLTYKNTGTQSLLITGVINQNTPFWEMASGSSCLNREPLVANASCSITYINKTADSLQYYLSQSSISLQFPELILSNTLSTQQFLTTPLPENGMLAVPAYYVVPSIQVSLYSNNDGIVEYRASAIINQEYSDYGAATISISTRMEDYFSGSENLENCSINKQNGLQILNCNLSLSPGQQEAIAQANLIPTKKLLQSGQNLSVNGLTSVTAGTGMILTPQANALINGIYGSFILNANNELYACTSSITVGNPHYCSLVDTSTIFGTAKINNFITASVGGNKYLYLILDNASIYRCNYSFDGSISNNSCSQLIPANGQINWQPTSITINGTTTPRAYITSSTGMQYMCNLSIADGTFTNCYSLKMSPLTLPNGWIPAAISVSDIFTSVAYILSGGVNESAVYVCNINESNGLYSNCNLATGSGDNTVQINYSNVTGFAASSLPRLYIPNSSTGDVDMCNFVYNDPYLINSCNKTLVNGSSPILPTFVVQESTKYANGNNIEYNRFMGASNGLFLNSDSNDRLTQIRLYNRDDSNRDMSDDKIIAYGSM